MKVFMKDQKSGFSAVEVLVVVAMIGILVGIGYPAFMNMLRKYRLNSMTSNLSSLFNLGRQKSVTRADVTGDNIVDEDDQVEARIDFNNNSYEVVYRGNGEPIKPLAEIPRGVSFTQESYGGDSNTEAYDGNYNTTPAVIEFEGDGSIDLPDDGGNSIVLEMQISSDTVRRGVIKMTEAGQIKTLFHNVSP